ncbi:GNAT family N-acetyltransferase [Streptomyces sp. NPDC052721]|uniref:GNAT family N-acetyltransferase n=1 Tax=Streptomyces sp. NPDC052721 TaxID=3154955 RepID=UPI0034320E4D
MGTPDIIEAAAQAWMASVGAIAEAVPGGQRTEREPGLALLATGAPLAAVNGVFDVRAAPRAAGIGDLAKRAAEAVDAPWCIQYRTGPDAEIAGVAADHGLTSTARSPFMVRELGEHTPGGGPLPAGLTVRALGAGDSAVFVSALAAGFEAPVETMSPLGCPEILALPCATGYLAELDGDVVATGLALRAEDCVGVFNISVLPARRRQGLGAAVTGAILRAEQDRGARVAYLHASDMGLSLYESLGFRTVEQWTRHTR